MGDIKATGKPAPNPNAALAAARRAVEAQAKGQSPAGTVQAAGEAVQTYQASGTQASTGKSRTVQRPAQLTEEQLDATAVELSKRFTGWNIERAGLTFKATRASDGLTLEKTADSASPDDIERAITSPVMSLRRSIEMENRKLQEKSTPRPVVSQEPVGATNAEEQTAEELFNEALNAEGGMLDTYRGTRPQQRIPIVADMYSRRAISKQQVRALIEKGYLNKSEITALAQNDTAKAILSPFLDE